MDAQKDNVFLFFILIVWEMTPKKIKLLDILDLSFLQSLAKVKILNFCLTGQLVLPGKKVFNPNKQYFAMNINTQIKIQSGISSWIEMRRVNISGDSLDCDTEVYP